jgi:regulator of RNase E activity RraA
MTGRSPQGEPAHTGDGVAATPAGIPRGVSCASLVDAVGRLYPHRSDLIGFATPTPGRVLFGPAVTIAFVPFRQDLLDEGRSFATLFYRAVERAGPRSVLVLSSGGHPGVSHGGGTKLFRAETTGLAGVLADGLLRDFAEFRDCKMAVYCRGEATRAGGDVVMPFDVNVTVEVGGVTVTPGDYLYVDGSGGVVIPAADLEQVLSMAREIATADEHQLAMIREERR